MNIFQITFSLLLFALTDCIGFFSSRQILQYNDYSSKLSKNSLNGYMLAFADFNADRYLDIFVLQKEEINHSVSLIQMPRKDSTYSKLIPLIKNVKDIRSIIVGDFNGDSYVDIVTCNSKNPKGPFTVYIAFGNDKRDGVGKLKKIETKSDFKLQPIHVDYNSDMIGDLFGVANDGFQLCLGSRDSKTKFSCKTMKDDFSILTKIGELQFIQFIDVNGDSNSDILFIGVNKDKVTLASLVKSQEKFIKGPSTTLDTKISKLGQPITGDFNFDGKLSLISPICFDDGCTESKLMGCTLSSEINCKILNMKSNGYKYQTNLPARLDPLATTEISQLNCGDTKLTGYLDCFVPMISEGNKNSELVRLSNLGGLDKGFEVKPLEVGKKSLATNISQVAIFDIEEDGVPDLFTTTTKQIIRPIKQDTPAESYFIKVMVLNGFCSSLDTCPGGKLPYGIPLPGVVLSYSTEGAITGKTQKSIASICPDSSYTSLQLPYNLFGLGSFANYVEKLTATIPYSDLRKSHSLSFIVPKTQIVIIPNPLENPKKWKNKLFLEPFLNHKVIYVAAALLGTMLVVAIVLCILQYLEVREDRQEKMAEAQKFHFNAM